MKKLSLPLLAETVVSKRKALKITQTQLAEKTGMNRSMLSRVESQDYIPSIEQLQVLGDVLQFEPASMFMHSAVRNGRRCVSERTLCEAKRTP